MAIIGLISGNIIQNTVICDSIEFAHILWPEYQILDISDMEPQPGIGWFLSGSNWTAPSVVSGSI